MNIDKKDLVLVRDSQKILDTELESKRIGYYQDSWNRFKKNKGAFYAFIIICVVLFFVVFGPYMRGYTLKADAPIEAARLGNLVPKVPGLEKLGFFDGTKKIEAGKQFLLDMNSNDFGKDIIISGLPQELIDNPDHPDYEDVTKLEVVVNHYRYTNYVSSYKPERYYSIVKQNEINQTDDDPLAEVKRTLTQEEFDEELKKNSVIDILQILETDNPADPEKPFFQYVVRLNQFKSTLGVNDPSDVYFWFGTTDEGGDLFTELWLGARISLIMALAVVSINSLVGLILGSLVGYYGGAFDLIMDRLVEIIVSIPFLSVLILLTLRYGNSLIVIIVAFTLTGWVGMYKTGRMQFYRFKNREYVFAARTLGASDARIMFKHIFPNTLGLIVTGLALSIPFFVFTEASYSFLGIIEYANATSVGMLINKGQAVMMHHPHLLLFPSAYISILMIAFNLFGNGLRDAFNPSLRGVE
ncbi:ABC transporter permease [Acidaminobacter sp. JC074]|uniref:ABC transporter permease n=1 Tax=Acidaminobacter sp. JC074 TaxID=2530199 RepID=UPI001F0DD7BE|nr:ABC transporter permease [Acidaminobacter sp. JC074]